MSAANVLYRRFIVFGFLCFHVCLSHRTVCPAVADTAAAAAAADGDDAETMMRRCGDASTMQSAIGRKATAACCMQQTSQVNRPSRNQLLRPASTLLLTPSSFRDKSNGYSFLLEMVTYKSTR